MLEPLIPRATGNEARPGMRGVLMLIKCHCGAKFDLPESYAGQAAECSECRKVLQFAVGALPYAAANSGDFAARLIVEAGPQDVGRQFLLGGRAPIEVGKLPEKAIVLEGPRVSRHHCRLIRTDRNRAAWRLEDAGSKNGVFVNRQRIQSQDLHCGDILHLGGYVMRYLVDGEDPGDGAIELTDADEASPEPPENGGLEDFGSLPEVRRDQSQSDIQTVACASPKPPMAVRMITPQKSPAVVQQGPVCPNCKRALVPGAKICVDCGIDLKTGKAIITSQGLDKEELDEKTRNAIRVLSWYIWFPPTFFLPVASDAFGTKKPYAIWTIAFATVIVSVMYWVATFGPNGNSPELRSLLLWRVHPVTREEVTQLIDRRIKEAQKEEGGGRLRIDDATRQQIIREAYQHYKGQSFHWYQLLTHALLHGDIWHIAGNLLFLLIFGSRVNALIGNIHAAIVYPLLAAAAGGAQLLFEKGFAPSLGASGAIMGMAGMYFVFFPVHKIYVVSWFRSVPFFFLLGLRLYYKVYAMRGFWVLLIFVGFDVWATLRASEDGVAHWAHLGGFAVGVAVAVLLLFTRLVDARGGDIFSRVLGKRAWLLVGRPRTQIAW